MNEMMKWNNMEEQCKGKQKHDQTCKARVEILNSNSSK